MINENYITQARNESCIQYASVYPNPRNYFSHLFFTNGNGTEFTDGNPVNIVSYFREIPWTEYYKQIIPFDKLKEFYIDRYLEQDVENTVELIDGKYSEVYKNAIADIDNIKELTLQDMLSAKYWSSTFIKTNYIPYNHLSNGFFKLQHLNNNTEITLLKIAKAFVFAYIEFYTYIINNKDLIPKFKPILNIKWNDADMEHVYNTCISDKHMLKIEYKKISKLISNYAG